MNWLGLLFWLTLLLLIFQLLLGWLARAVTLIADSAHGAADTLSYGLNFLVEWLKFRREQEKSRDEDSANVAAHAAKLVDTWGSLASLLTLVFAASFAGAEAAERLAAPSGEDVYKIGPALLAFAIVSTIVNVYILAMYRRWHSKSASKYTPRWSAAVEREATVPIGNEEAQAQPSAEPDEEPVLFCMPCEPSASNPQRFQVTLPSKTLASLPPLSLKDDPVSPAEEASSSDSTAESKSQESMEDE